MRKRILLGTAALVVVIIVGVLLLWPGGRAPRVPEARPRESAASGELSAGGAGRAGEVGARGDDPRTDLTIRGQVLGPEGPVAGATVLATTSAGDDVLSERHCQCGNECGRKLLECGCGEAAAQLLELVAERRGEVQPVASATADGDGRFVLTGLADGVYAIWAEAPRAGTGVVEGIQAGDGEVAVKLDADTVISGTVVREDGRSVAGAVVTAIYAKHSRFFEVATGSNGAFSLGPLPGGGYTVVAAAPGLLPARERVANGSSRSVRLELARPRSLTGRIVLDAAPAGGAVVSLHGEHKRLEARTAPGGAFAFEGLRPGTYALGAAVGERVAQETVTIAEGDVEGVMLVLQAGVYIQGKVVDDAGAAIAAVRITADELAPAQRTRVAGSRSGADGRFRLGPLEPGEFALSARREGYVRSEDVRVIAVENASAELVLVRAQPIRGRVVDAAGGPVADVHVDAVVRRARTSGDEEEVEASARSAEDGTFTLDVPGGEYEISADPEGFKEARVTARAPASDVLIRLERGATIEGEVVDENGAPMAGADVSVTSAEDEHEGRGEARTDRGGHFAISGLSAGSAVVIARPAANEGEWSDGSTALARVDLRDAGTTTVKLRLGAWLAISGTVVGPDGAGVPSAQVIAWIVRGGPRANDLGARLAEGSWGEGVTDRSGRFTIRGLKAGEHVLAVLKEGFDLPRGGVRARAGDSGVRISLTRSAILRVRVVGDGGAPISRFRVNGATKEAPDGRFAMPVTSIPGLDQRPSESIGVRLGADGYALAERTVTVERGVDVDLGDVVLSRGRTVYGLVVDAETAAPIAAARVWTLLPEEAKPASEVDRSAVHHEGLVLSLSDGTFAISHVGEGALLRVARDGYVSVSVALGADRPEPLRVALRRATTLRLSLSGSGAEGPGMLPVALVHGVVPRISSAEDLRKIAAHPIGPEDEDAPGARIFERLEPGPYTVLVMKMEDDGFRVFTQRIDVGAGPRQEADVVVPAGLPLLEW